MKVLPLRGKRGEGKYTLLDDQDFDRLGNMGWYLHPEGYAIIGAKRLHRFVLDAPKGTEVDHINGDKLDNRRSNLRLCTRADNNRNTPSKPHTSKFKGVHMSSTGRWRASIGASKKMIQLGTFDTEEMAALAYNAAARFYYGAFARLNVVDGIEPTLQEVLQAKKPRWQKSGICTRCNQNPRVYVGGRCKACNNELNREWRAKRVKDSRQTFTREDVE